METNKLHNEFLEAMWVSDDVLNVVKITSKWVKTNFYTQSWVDIDAWDDFSATAWKVCRASYNNSPYLIIEDMWSWSFRWPKWFQYVNLPDGIFHTLAPDWDGTKVILIETLWDFTWTALDVVAMTWDDIARYGWMSQVFTSVLDTKTLKWSEENYKEMILKLWVVAKEQWFAILNWETAELPGCVSSTNLMAKTAFNWAWVMEWVFLKEKMILWDKVEAWDLLVVLKQDWFWSNWLSWVREWFRLEYWEDYYNDAPREEIVQAASPSIPYARAIAEANGWYSPWFKTQVNMTWIAHLSWWSFKWKLLEDMLGVNKLSAEFDNLFPIPEIAKKVAIWSQKSEEPMKSLEELYSTWCAWQRMAVAVKTQEDADKLIQIMANNWIEAKVAWKVIETPEWEEPSINISNIR